MRCDQGRELLSARRDGALAAEEEAALSAHLAGCAECAGHDRQLAALVDVLRSPAARAGGAPPEVRRRLEATFGTGGRARGGRGRVVAGWVAAAAAGVLVAWWSGPDRGGSTIEQASGTVEILRGGTVVRAERGGALERDDVVRTAAGGRARLHLGAGARVVLGPESRLRVGRRPDAAFLGRGHAAFEVEPGRGDFRVATPAGEVAVTGTSFEIDLMSIDEEADAMKRVTVGVFGAALVGAAVAVVHVSRGSVALRGGEGAPVTIGAGESGQLIRGRPAVRAAPAGAGVRPVRLEDRLETQNAALRAEVEGLRAQVARQQAQAVALPTRATVDSPKDPRAPLTSDERKLLGAANLRVSAESRAKLAALYQEVHGRAPPAELDELALGRELVKELRFHHVPALGAKTDRIEDLVAAGVPRTAARAMGVFQDRNRRLRAELEKTLTPERAAAVAATIVTRTTVGRYNGRDEAGVEQDVPPDEGEPLPANEKRNNR